MRLLSKEFNRAPIGARIVPFILFILAPVPQALFGEEYKFWFYLAKTLLGAWLVWETWPFVKEMRWAISWEAMVVGVGVFVMWVGLDPFYPPLSDLMSKHDAAKQAATAPLPWNPFLQFKDSAGMAWFFVAVRILGSTIVVPPLEEVFYRSFLYRYIAKPDFESVPLGKFLLVPFLITAAIFASTHQQWLAAILCGFAYHGLVLYKKRLGDAMTAHAITNFLLGIYVVWRGEWQFW